MLKEGSWAWEIKDYLVNQERCESVTIEGQDFPGKGSDKVDLPPVFLTFSPPFPNIFLNMPYIICDFFNSLLS